VPPENENWLITDPQREAPLDDVGLPCYTATVAVDRDGNETLWLAGRPLLGDRDADRGNPNPPHERLGRLPRHYRDALWGDQLRCGRPTASGRPCQARVAKPGDACGQHRASQPQGLPR
jgi:hypothetical protein